MIPASGSEQDGSHIILRRCQINFIESIISSSVILIIFFTSLRIIGKKIGVVITGGNIDLDNLPF